MGTRLVSRLTAQGHTVRVLTRDVNRARGQLPYGRLEFFAPSDWGRALAGATAVVNLAGKLPSRALRLPTMRAFSGSSPLALCFGKHRFEPEPKHDPFLGLELGGQGDSCAVHQAPTHPATQPPTHPPTDAGEPIATRWSAAHKVEIKRSRVGVTRRLTDSINALPQEQRPSVMVSCSAVGEPALACKNVANMGQTTAYHTFVIMGVDSFSIAVGSSPHHPSRMHAFALRHSSRYLSSSFSSHKITQENMIHRTSNR